MIKEKRIQRIEEYVSKNQTASLDELVKVFNVSKNTIRRDIQELVERGDFRKVYGGIAINEKKLESFQDRQVKNQKGKALIGKLASEFVEDGDIIFIDSGTTTIEMFEYIKENKITILTNNIEFIVRSIPFPSLNIISTGGILERETNAFTTLDNTELFNTYNINKAFMATTGISLSKGVTNSSPLETGLKQAIVQKSSKVFLLVDSTKFEKLGLMTYCQLADVDYIVSDEKILVEYEKYAAEHDIHIIAPK
ncbi:DeoR/GlpR family DNA-binding transcription regulator [Caldifermentibacillus hisashii]|uniref:DeoR/GlpR family DNA-binding transcription regulator n=1 Tax=Caldifermentibacillus hisashii TaxID=996558 RepID=UPI0030EA441A